MSAPIAVGVALRQDDGAPLALAAALARFTGATLTLIHIPPDDPPSRVHALAFNAERHERALERVRALAEPLGATAHLAAGSSIVQGLHEAVETLDAGLLVVGSSHRGTVGRVMPGGVGERLLHGATSAVAIAPRGYAGPRIARIGAAYADTPEGREALAAAATMAALAEIPLSVFSTIERGPTGRVPAPSTRLSPAHRDPAPAFAATERQIRSLLPDGLDATIKVTEGDPVAMLEAASADVDLLVCGSRGRGPLRTVLLGGVSGRLAHRAACPLVVLPRAAAPAEPPAHAAG